VDTIKRILGEEDASEEITEPDDGNVKTWNHPHSNRYIQGEDIEIDELANLWKGGNHQEVIRRFMDMDNETSVKLVFAIGYDSAVELAMAVDLALEQGIEPEEGEEAEKETTEPMNISANEFEPAEEL
jgi:hypothetical protein